MKTFLMAVSLLSALAAAGCATAYTSEQLTGGYDENQQGPDTWTIKFYGNGFTTKETAQTFWLYRAAELTLQKGYDGFQITSPMALITFPAAPDLGRAHLFQTAARDATGFLDVQFKPFMVGTIRMLKKPLTPNPPRVFDAAALKASLEPIVKGKLCDSGNVCPHVHDYLRPPLAS